MIKDSDSANPIPLDRNDLPDPYPTLGALEVHVWHANLDVHAAASLQPVLTEDEISRANQFHFARDRNHYIVGRGLLRKLLAGYLGTDAADLRLVYAEKGKPALKPALDESQGLLRFNLAHSHGRAIYAFSRDRELGVDLEFMREDFASDRIAQRFFSPTEIAALMALPPELRQQAFFDCWTRKEAYIKARGEGLSQPLDEFDVSLRPGEPAALLRNHKEPTEVARWRMESIPAPSGYAAALVVEGHDWNLKTFQVEQRAE